MSSCPENPAQSAERSTVLGWRRAGICILLILLVFLVFGRTFHFDFVNYDDDRFVTENRHVQHGLTWENVDWSLTAGIGKNSVDIDFWRPLSLLSHMLDVELFGLKAGAHHAMSVGIHVLTTVALFLVLCSMTGMLWRSAFVAAVFAIHPLHVESVAWVAERKDVLSGLFFMLTLGGYVRYARRPFGFGNYLLVVGMFALGLMSKPMVVTLPCVLLLLDYWPLGRLGSVPVGRLLLEKAPLLAMSAAVAVLTTKGPGGSNDVMMTSLPLSWRVANAVVAYGTYLWQTVWPAGLACLYPHPRENLGLWSVALALVVLLAITGGVAWQRKRRYLAVGWLWYVGMLVPVIGIIQSGMQARADRYTYLPMIGVYLMVTWAVADWVGERLHRRLAMGVLGVAVLCVLVVAAHRQSAYWRDGMTLWTHTLECTKENSVAHNNLGGLLAQRGRTEEATTHFREALQISPAFAIAHYNLGHALVQQGRMEEATAHLREALRLNAALAGAHNNLGDVLLDQGRTEEAIAQYREALQINPAYGEVHFRLGTVFLGLGRWEEAVTHTQKALELEPSNGTIQNNLAWMLATVPESSLRNGARALELAMKATQASGGNDPVTLDTLAAVYAEAGDFSNALQTARKALQLAEAQSKADLAEALRREIKLYEAGQPYREGQ